jgi:hypothetical protein
MTDAAAGPEIESAPEPTRDELRAQAQVLGIPTSGTKADIATRIDVHLAGIAERAKSVTTDDFREGTWKGLPNYECGRCSFASLHRRDTIIHIASNHR